MIKQITLIIVTIKRFKQVPVVSIPTEYTQIPQHVLLCIDAWLIFTVLTMK